MSEISTMSNPGLEREIYDELRTVSGHLRAIQFSAAWIAFLLTTAAVIVVVRGFAS